MGTCGSRRMVVVYEYFHMSYECMELSNNIIKNRGNKIIANIFEHVMRRL